MAGLGSVRARVDRNNVTMIIMVMITMMIVILIVIIIMIVFKNMITICSNTDSNNNTINK